MVYSATIVSIIIKQLVIGTRRPNNLGACIDIDEYRVSCKVEYSLT